LWYGREKSNPCHSNQMATVFVPDRHSQCRHPAIFAVLYWRY
jgi:hypothetical protein